MVVWSGCTQGMLQTRPPVEWSANLVVGYAQSLPFGDGVFDLVFGFTVIQHIPPMDQADAFEGNGTRTPAWGPSLATGVDPLVRTSHLPRRPSD